MKKTNAKKKLLPAIGMLAISAAMLSSATFAWFTMNKTVQVTNMQVKAKADQGLLINEVADHTDANWDDEATTSQSEGILLHATSTKDTKSWYVAYSTKANTAAAATANTPSEDLTSDGYSTLGTSPYTTAVEELISQSAGASGKTEVTYVDKDGDSSYDAGEGYYVKYTYYLKSSGDAIALTTSGAGQSLNIEDVTVTGNTGAVTSQNLDKALRVAIVVNGKAYIYAPLYDTTSAAYYVNADANSFTPLSKAVSQPTAMTQIPSVTTDGTPVYVYLYFEGEDPNLKTENASSALDNLTVSFKFTLATNAAAVTDAGVTIPTNQGG